MIFHDHIEVHLALLTVQNDVNYCVNEPAKWNRQRFIECSKMQMKVLFLIMKGKSCSTAVSIFCFARRPQTHRPGGSSLLSSLMRSLHQIPHGLPKEGSQFPEVNPHSRRHFFNVLIVHFHWSRLPRDSFPILTYITLVTFRWHSV